MKLMASEIDGFEFGIGDRDAGGKDIFVEFAANFQAGLCRRGGDQLHDEFVVMGARTGHRGPAAALAQAPSWRTAIVSSGRPEAPPSSRPHAARSIAATARARSRRACSRAFSKDSQM